MHTIGLGQYAYVPIRYHRDTHLPIRYVLGCLSIAILRVMRFDIAISVYFFNTMGKVE